VKLTRDVVEPPPGPRVPRGTYSVVVIDMKGIEEVQVHMRRLGDPVELMYILRYGNPHSEGVVVVYEPLNIYAHSEAAETLLNTVEALFRRGEVIGEECREGG